MVIWLIENCKLYFDFTFNKIIYKLLVTLVFDMIIFFRFVLHLKKFSLNNIFFVMDG